MDQHLYSTNEHRRSFQDQLKTLMDELKTLGYTPLLGMFGVGGPYGSGYGPLGDAVTPRATVFYFQSSRRIWQTRFRL